MLLHAPGAETSAAHGDFSQFLLFSNGIDASTAGRHETKSLFCLSFSAAIVIFFYIWVLI